MRRLPVFVLVAGLVVGCGGGSTEPISAGITLAEAHVTRLPATETDARSAGSAVNAFGLALYAKARSGSGNIVASPASIAIALSMARAGAAGTTAGEMDAVLHDLATDPHERWIASLDQALTGRSGSFQDNAGQTQQVTLRIVNAPFAQRGMALVPSYLDALSARFDAGLRLVDYKAAPEDARSALNAWVADQTEQRIKELLAQGTIDRDSRLTLVNAIYLKAAWQHPFLKDSTTKAPFHAIGGTTLEVPTMGLGADLPYAEGTGWRTVELPYIGGKLAMDVIVPDDLAAFETTLDPATLDAITRALTTRHVILGMPKFSTASSLSLGDTLSAMGMPTAFTDKADFSGITTEEPLYISAVVHQANIDVDENGTTAAAATAVAMAAAAMPIDTITMQVDRPFLFALRDLDTGAVLFLGRITDPSAATS